MRGPPSFVVPLEPDFGDFFAYRRVEDARRVLRKPRPSVWESALPAADFDLRPDRLSLSTDDAFFAAAGEVTFFGSLRWDSALPAAPFDFDPDFLLRSVLDA